MPLFKFRVADPSGQTQDLLVEGANETDATRRLRQRGLLPLDFLGATDAAANERAWAGRRRFDVYEFTDRLVPLLQAAIPLERSLAILEDSSEQATERQIVADLRRGLHEGRKFSQLVRDQGRLFPRMYAGIVEAGEESGALPQVLAQLRDYLATTREMRQYILAASIYPILLVCFSLLVNLLLLGLVVPRFAAVIYSTGRQPAFTTRMLLHASTLVHDYWWALLLGLPALAALAVYLLRRPAVQTHWHVWALRLPLVKRLVILANIGRQVRTMAILMESGVALLETVAISASVLSNEELRRAVAGLATDLRRGERLSVALARSEYIPRLVIRMLAVGEETGETAKMLTRVADRYDHDLRQLVKRTLAWFEPLVILLLGSMVGTIVLVLYLAILDMQSSF